MKVLHRLFRLMRINFILMRYNIDEIVLGMHRFSLLRFAVYFNPYYWTTRNKFTRSERIRLALSALGPIFVKAGQIISTRRDIIPDDIAQELMLLQDRVPPFSGVEAKVIVESALQAPLAAIFREFNVAPLASASIAQVHAATLLTGEEVVVKVLRPNIKKAIDRDIDLLRTLARLADTYSANARQLKPREIVEEIAQTLYYELDLVREGANATQLKRNFAHSPILHVPKIYWDYSHATILVMERVYGIPIHDIEKLRTANVDMQLLAKRGIEIFFTQVFRDSFFHADLHPGNIFVSIKDPHNPTYAIVDFGIVGSLNHTDQRYLAENMIAFFKRDYQRVAELHIACGWLPPNTRIDQFEGAIRAVSEPIFERPLHDISFGQLLMRLFQVARQFHINIQPQLILLQKTLLSIEGLCRQLAPQLDVWSEAAPQIERWLKKQVGFGAFLKRIRNNLPLWSEQLPEMPSLLYEVLRETKQQQEKNRFAEETEEKRKRRMRREKVVRINYFIAGVILALIGVGVGFYLG